MTEERVVPLDISGVESDTLEILLTPAAGFWSINSLAVDYSEDVPITIRDIAPRAARGDDGTDLMPTLTETDGEYYVASTMGQCAYLTFPEPPLHEGLARSVFAEVSGYYRINLDASGPVRMEELARIEHEEGYVVRLALEQYLDWREQQFALFEERRRSP